MMLFFIILKQLEVRYLYESISKKIYFSIISSVRTKRSIFKKELSAFDLTMLGVGAIIGTGIFVLTGVAAAEHAGPALVLSFILSSLACVFAALCYSEFASTVTVSGSAYTYSYAAFGELIAWILGWDLTYSPKEFSFLKRVKGVAQR